MQYVFQPEAEGFEQPTQPGSLDLQQFVFFFQGGGKYKLRYQEQVFAELLQLPMLGFGQYISMQRHGRIIFFFHGITPWCLDTPRIARGVRG
jgi:hypothetical protein